MKAKFMFLSILVLALFAGCDKSELPEIKNPNLRDTTRLPDPVNQNVNQVTVISTSASSGSLFSLVFMSNFHKSLTSNKVTVKIGNYTCSNSSFGYTIDTSGKYYTYFISVILPSIPGGTYPLKVMVNDGSMYEYNFSGNITVTGSTVKKLYLKSLVLKTFILDTLNSFNYFLVLYDIGGSSNLLNSQTITLTKSGTNWIGNQTWNISPSFELSKYNTTGYEVYIYVNGEYKKSAPIDFSGITENVTTTLDFQTPALATPYDYTATATFEWK